MIISWIQHHGRSARIASLLDLDARWVTSDGRLAVRYVRQVLQTRKLLREELPRVTLVMLPPFPALVATWLTSRSTVIVADVHTGALYDRKWRWSIPSLAWLLRRRGGAIVTNDDLAARLERLGVATLTLHDPLAENRLAPSTESLDELLVPLSYAADEPVGQLLTAIREHPDKTFYLTGRAPESLRAIASPNVVFTGFISLVEYEELAGRVGAIIALTTREHTMQRAGYEAIELGKPLITSRKDVLVDYFESAAVYAEPTRGSISEAISVLDKEYEYYVKEMFTRRGDILATQQRDRSRILTWVDSLKS